MTVGGIVLCGGTSRRMGTSKAWLDFCGEPMLARVTRVVASVATTTVVVGQEDQSLPALPTSCEIVHDRIASAGPLAGIEAGLAALSESCGAALVVSCDHPLVSTNFLRALTERLGDHSAVVPIHEGRTYPLLAIYRVSVLPLAQQLLDEGERRISAFVTNCNAARIEATALVDGADLRSLINVNDRTSLENALRRASEDSS